MEMTESDHLATLYHVTAERSPLFFIKTLKLCLTARFGTLTMVLLNASVLWDDTSSGCVPSKPMSSGGTTLLRLIVPEDARVMIFLKVDIVAVSGTSSLHPQRAGNLYELCE